MIKDLLENVVILESTGICADKNLLDQILQKYMNQDQYYLRTKIKLEDQKLDLVCFLRIEFCKSSKNKLIFIDTYAYVPSKNIFLGSVKLRGKK